MFIFGCVVLYGGLVLCIAIAIRKNKKSKSLGEPPS